MGPPLKAAENLLEHDAEAAALARFNGAAAKSSGKYSECAQSAYCTCGFNGAAAKSSGKYPLLDEPYARQYLLQWGRR